MALGGFWRNSPRSGGDDGTLGEVSRHREIGLEAMGGVHCSGSRFMTSLLVV